MRPKPLIATLTAILQYLLNCFTLLWINSRYLYCRTKRTNFQVSAKKITTLFYIFRILYDFSKKGPLIFGELSILPGIFGFWGVFYANNCAYRSQRPNGTQAQFNPGRRPAQLACRPA